MEMHILFYLGVIFILGALSKWIAPKVGVPKVVGYLLLGVVIGPNLLDIIPQAFVDGSHFVIDLALAIIAVMIGGTLKYSMLKESGKAILTITFFQAFFAFFILVLGLYSFGAFFNFPTSNTLAIAIVFGGLGVATAPAATIAIIHELKAKGKLTSMLLGVVALDDVMTVIIFSFALAISGALINMETLDNGFILHSFLSLFLSALLGIIGAIVATGLNRLFSHNKGIETISTLGAIFILYGLSDAWELEMIFSALVMGVVMTNISAEFDVVEEEIDNHLEEIIFMLFFILSAMHLKLTMIGSMMPVMVAYVIFRMVGKALGVYIGATLSHTNHYTKHYLALGLFPQAGLAMGLALSLQYQNGFETIAPYILNVVIATTLIHELIGPFLTKYILIKSREVNRDVI
ncbi:MAG: cation:proton antiporter [Campylobacterota bacterium]|nr:cation:proton antiporter [Campylobacterota bacterium]